MKISRGKQEAKLCLPKNIHLPSSFAPKKLITSLEGLEVYISVTEFKLFSVRPGFN